MIIVIFIPLINCHAQIITDESIHQHRLVCDSIDTIVNGLKYPAICRVKAWAWGEYTTIYEVNVSMRTPKIANVQFSDTVDGFSAGWAKWLITDMNFDGYPDIRVASYVGMHGDVGYSYYLFNPTTKIFSYNEELSELHGEIKFDDISKTIIEEGLVWSGGPHDWKNIYRVSENKLLQIENNDEKEWQEGDSLYFMKTFRSKLVNGQMVVLEDTTEIRDLKKEE
jgi:hypothetical protein